MSEKTKIFFILLAIFTVATLLFFGSIAITDHFNRVIIEEFIDAEHRVFRTR